MAGQQPPQLPVPNLANIQASINGMTAQRNAMQQNAQAFDNHQQQFTIELSRSANYPAAQIQQQLNAINQSIHDMQARMDAQFWNLNAKMHNSRVSHATGALVVMRSIQQGPNPRVPVNQPIPNFPATPDHISQMNHVQQCRDILISLDMPIVPGRQLRQLRTDVREAIGLPAL
jgi:hypothetical protein